MKDHSRYDSATIKRKLAEIGIEKLYIMYEDVDCALFLGIHGYQQFLILVSKGKFSWYSKIVPANIVLEPYWNCEHITYVPEGLYVFAEDIEELTKYIIKVLEKYSKLKNYNST
ncbi:MAG: hypothetical protein QW775_04310 [Ignisphaera sp.]|uniref:Uncharacterized protein n=1 Tax=Ignisphaera aggregans TaxID=334771 RepID=A0A7C4JKY4_9CREN